MNHQPLYLIFSIDDDIDSYFNYHFQKRERQKGKMSITDDSGGEDNKTKVADTTSSRRNSPLTSTTPSQENNYSKSTRQSSLDAKDISDTTSPGSSASSMIRKSRLKRSPTMQSNKGRFDVKYGKLYNSLLLLSIVRN